MQGKYIIFERNGLEYPVLFPNHYVNHNDLDDIKGTPVSAGFFYIDGSDVSVIGESISLNLKSRPEDKEIIEQFFK